MEIIIRTNFHVPRETRTYNPGNPLDQHGSFSSPRPALAAPGGAARSLAVLRATLQEIAPIPLRNRAATTTILISKARLFNVAQPLPRVVRELTRPCSAGVQGSIVRQTQLPNDGRCRIQAVIWLAAGFVAGRIRTCLRRFDFVRDGVCNATLRRSCWGTAC